MFLLLLLLPFLLLVQSLVVLAGQTVLFSVGPVPATLSNRTYADSLCKAHATSCPIVWAIIRFTDETLGLIATAPFPPGDQVSLLTGDQVAVRWDDGSILTAALPFQPIWLGGGNTETTCGDWSESTTCGMGSVAWGKLSAASPVTCASQRMLLCGCNGG